MTSASAGHIILTLTKPVRSGRPQLESNPGPPHGKIKKEREKERKRELKRDAQMEIERKKEDDRGKTTLYCPPPPPPP